MGRRENNDDLRPLDFSCYLYLLLQTSWTALWRRWRCRPPSGEPPSGRRCTPPTDTPTRLRADTPTPRTRPQGALFSPPRLMPSKGSLCWNFRTVYGELAGKRVAIGLSYRPARARICKPFKEPRNRFSAWRAGTSNPVFRTGSPDYIGWRNRFLGIDSWTPYTFTNTGSG